MKSSRKNSQKLSPSIPQEEGEMTSLGEVRGSTMREAGGEAIIITRGLITRLRSRFKWRRSRQPGKASTASTLVTAANPPSPIPKRKLKRYKMCLYNPTERSLMPNQNNKMTSTNNNPKATKENLEEVLTSETELIGSKTN